MKMRLNKKGFTLIELVIVIAVLAIIAIVAVPAVNGIVDSAKDSSDKAQMALIQGAVERYNATNGHYPAADLTNPSNAEIKTAVTNALATYTNLSAIPSPQKSGKYFFYDRATGKVTYGPTGNGTNLNQ